MEFISHDTIRMKNSTDKKPMTLQYRAPKLPTGEMDVTVTGFGARKEVFTREALARTISLPEGEMMSQEDVHTFAKQSVLDVSLGMAEHPTLYPFIYQGDGTYRNARGVRRYQRRGKCADGGFQIRQARYR